MYRVSQKWRTNGALRCRGDYRKHQKNVKKILLDLFSDLAVFECGTQQVRSGQVRSGQVRSGQVRSGQVLKYMYEIVMTATSNRTYYHKV
jgi:hypothetical protein